MKTFDRRLRFLSVGIILFALVLVAKLYFVQIVSGASFKAKADHQYVEGANYFDRGSIFFTDKDGNLVPAAGIKSGFILAIDPEIFAENKENLSDVFGKANAITPIDSKLFNQKASATSSSYAELDTKLPVEIADQIQALSIPGLSVYEQQWRVYPGNSMAAHVVGFEGYGGANNDELAGRYGLERYYEPVLARSGDDTFVNFFAEVFSDIKKSVSPGQSLGGDIVTTIEPSVEEYLEEQIQGVQDQYHSEFTGGIVIDPNTGEIYAMALTPTFDPNDPQAQASSAVFTNNSVEDRYEMGSIFKALTMAAGIDSGAVTPTSTYNDPGCVTLDKKTFCNYDNKSHGQNLPMQIILDESLNTGAAYVEQQMGNATFSKYMLSYGIGSTTGIDLPNEGNSLVSHLTSGDDLEYAEASFGQGVAITPIQAARAFSVLANGGYLITPHLVKEIDYNIGTKKIINPGKGAEVLKPSTTTSISRMLTEVVDVALMNGAVKLQNYSIAAKTGTAQIANPAGGYYTNHYVHSFFGYFPSYNPRFLIFLYTYYPKNVQYASETLTPSFMNMAKFLINYYNIPPDRTAPPPPTALCANNDC